MNINIIDYNGISIWTICSKTKSWKTHYVTRGLGAPLILGYRHFRKPPYVPIVRNAMHDGGMTNPSAQATASKVAVHCLDCRANKTKINGSMLQMCVEMLDMSVAL